MDSTNSNNMSHSPMDSLASHTPFSHQENLTPQYNTPNSSNDGFGDTLQRLLNPLARQLEEIGRRVGRIENYQEQYQQSYKMNNKPSIPVASPRIQDGVGPVNDFRMSAPEVSASGARSPFPRRQEPYPITNNLNHRHAMLSALGQSEDLILKLMEENQLLRRRLELASIEISRLRSIDSSFSAPHPSIAKKRILETGEYNPVHKVGNLHRAGRIDTDDDSESSDHPIDLWNHSTPGSARNSDSFEHQVNKPIMFTHQHTNPLSTDPVSQVDIRHLSPVNYPEGYNPRKRRFSVSSESYNPEKFKNSTPLRQPPKSEDLAKKLADTVKDNVLFKHLEPYRIADVVNAMWEVKYGPGHVVIKEGDDGDNMYVIEKGELEALYSGEVVGKLGPGKVFGETALMYNCPRTATIRTLTDVVLWAIDRSTFRRIIMQQSIKQRALYQEFLSKVPLLENLLEYERAKVADALEPVYVNDGEVIIKQGSTDVDGFYIIESGTVVCTKEPESKDSPSEPSSSGSSVEAIRLGPGDYFGELALLLNQPRAATVVASGPVKLLRITKKHFDQVMGPCEEILKRNTNTYASYEKLIGGAKQQRAMSRESVGSDTPRRHSSSSTDRTDIIKNAIQSEIDYVKILQKIVAYKEAMKVETELRLTSHDIKMIFSNVKELLAIHSKFLESFQQHTNHSNQETKSVIETIGSLIPQLERYIPYIQSFYCSILVRKKRKAIPSFNNYFKKLKDIDPDKQDLDELLEYPFRRAGYYAELLLDLAATVSSQEVKKTLTTMINSIKQILSQLEIVRVRAEQVYAIQQNITGEAEFIQNPSREFIIEGNLTMVSEEGSQYVYCFLFNDIMVFTTQIEAGAGRPKLAHFKTVYLQSCTIQIDSTSFTLIWDKHGHFDGTKDSITVLNDRAWLEQIQARIVLAQVQK